MEEVSQGPVSNIREAAVSGTGRDAAPRRRSRDDVPRKRIICLRCIQLRSERSNYYRSGEGGVSKQERVSMWDANTLL